MSEPRTNHYGQPVIEDFDGEHYAALVPTAAGSPPVCSCGWTRRHVDGRWVELYEHLQEVRT